MSKRERADARNLTGIWNGLYTYQDGRTTAFVATLIESGSSVCGTTHESGTRGGGLRTTLYASLAGARSELSVTFTKTYDHPDAFHHSPILYDGVLNGDGTEIEGRWTIVKTWSGKFLMIRSPGQEMKATRKAFART